MPNWLCLPEAAGPLDVDLVVSFRPSRALRAQSGISTPNPAADSSGPVSRKNSSAPAVSSVTSAGCRLAQRGVERGEQPGRGAEAGEQFLLWMAGALARAPTSQPYPAPVHTSAAGSIRLGSSADWSENSTRQSSGPPAGAGACSATLSSAAVSSAAVSSDGGSTRRKQVRTEPPGSAELASQSVNSAASSLASRSSVPSATSRRGCGPVRASSIRSATGDTGGAAAAARGQQRAGQPGADRCVGRWRRACPRAADPARLPTRPCWPGPCWPGQTAGGRHRGGELAGVPRVGGGQHRPPAGGSSRRLPR